MTTKEYIDLWATRCEIRMKSHDAQNLRKSMHLNPLQPLPKNYQLWKLMEMLEAELTARGRKAEVYIDAIDGTMICDWR